VLRIIRSYLELDMFAYLTIHTEVTLSAGREELQRYGDLIKVLFNSLFRILCDWALGFSCIIFRNINNTFRSPSLGTSRKHILTNTFSMTLNEKV
jgi:hypothetical protein